MEVAGLAIGVVGLAALVDSCKRLMGRIESFQHVGSEARPILVEFSASKHLFDRWLQHVKVTEESIQTISGEKVDEKTAQVIRDLVSCIEDSLKTIEAVVSDFWPSGPEGAHGGDQPTLKKRPTGFSTKTKFQWAFSKKEKAIKGIQEFYRLVEKLHAVIPVSGPSGDPKHSQSLAHTLPDEFTAHLDKLLERYKAEDRRSVNQWLGAKSTESYYEERLRECQKGTCSWIFDRPDFLSWVSSDFPNDSAKLLWLHAPAGFGKTTICAKIVESLKTATPAATALYFFSERENETDAILRSWISQAAYQHDGILEIIGNNPRLTSTPMATHFDLERIFRSIAESALEFTFVIDGLDECEDSRGHPADFTETNRHQFVMKLRELISGTRTRVMVVSRPFLDIRSAIHPDESERGLIVYEIPMTEDDVGDDLKVFSKAIVDKKLSNRPEDLRAELANQMAERASGMFLWVKLHQSALRRSKNQNQLREIILRMPEGLNHTYEKNMERIEALDRVDRARAYLILMWIMVGDSPPTVGQIAIGFAIQRSGARADLRYDELPDIIDQDYINEEIINTCASLVEVNADSRVHSLQHQSIRFVHSSVRDYLTQVISDDSMSVPFSDNDLQRGFICLLLLHFLNYESVWEPPLSFTTDLHLVPFLDFATLSWLRYFPYAPSEELWVLVNEFFSLNNAKWERWRAEFEAKQVLLTVLSMPDFWWENRMDLSDILPRVVSMSIQEHPDYPEASEVERINHLIRDRIGDMGFTSTGQRELFNRLKLLVDKVFPAQHDFEKRLFTPGTRLYYAVQTRNLGLVRAVAGNDPKSINTPGGACGGALQLACSLALPDIVKELIDQGVNVNMQSGSLGCALSAAALCGSQCIVDMLLRSGANASMCDSFGTDALFYAVENSHTEVVKQLVRHGADINTRYIVPTDQGMELRTNLLLAAEQDDAEIVGLFLERGADISAETIHQETCLHRAAGSGATRVVDIILDRGYFHLLNARDSAGFTPLFTAISNNHQETSCRLISHGAKLDITSDNGMTPLHWAVDRKLLNVVHAILEHEASIDINSQDSDGDTPLHLAAIFGDKDICRKLLDYGADPELECDHGCFPIHEAVRRNNIETVDFLLDNVESMLEAKDSDGGSPLHIAAKLGLIEMARHLLNRGANVHAQNDYGSTPLIMAAVLNEQTVMVDLLISHSANILTPNNFGLTPILVAARNGQLEMYKTLRRHGADETATDNAGMNILHRSVEGGCIELVQFLVDRGWDMKTADNLGRTAVHHAANKGFKGILALLLDRGTYEATLDSRRQSPLHVAVANGHVGCLEVLLDRGLTDGINTRDSDGRTPLQNAAAHGHNDVVKPLLAWLPDHVNDHTENGNTPLALATFNGHARVMETLVEHGADTSLTASNGDSLLQLAVEQGHIQAVKVLLKDLHRQMSLSEVRPIPFSASKLRKSQSLLQIEKRSAISEDENSDDKRSIRSV